MLLNFDQSNKMHSCLINVHNETNFRDDSVPGLVNSSIQRSTLNRPLLISFPEWRPASWSFQLSAPGPPFPFSWRTIRPTALLSRQCRLLLPWCRSRYQAWVLRPDFCLLSQLWGVREAPEVKDKIFYFSNLKVAM